MERTSRLPYAIATAVAVPAAIATGVTMWLVSRPQPAGDSGPVPAAPLPVSFAPPAPGRAASCQALVGRLPANLLEAARRPVAGPGDRFAAAFGAPPIVVRCDAARQAVARTDLVYLVSGTCWATRPAGDSTSWTTVDRDIAVGVSVPNHYSSQGQYIEALAGAVRDTLARSEALPSGCRAAPGPSGG
ncbi:DUF3515 family protein [Dactylosporangium sp. NPDC005555]|uniref:DUF3515 family protein n=1 Tax=Dactylosporangium sp. NPDC005555 TaxID=3154889 RepID=UPI0033A1AD8E